MDIVILLTLEYFSIDELVKVLPILSKGARITYLESAKFTILSSYELRNLYQISKGFTLHTLKVNYIVSSSEVEMLKNIKGKYIKLYCSGKSGPLTHIKDVLQNFSEKCVFFYKSFMNFPMVFNLLMANSTNTMLIFYSDWLYLDEHTIIERSYSPESFFYDYNPSYRYLTKHDFRNYLESHPFLYVLVDSFEITPFYFKFFN